MDVSVYQVESSGKWAFEVRKMDSMKGTLIGNGFGFKTHNEAWVAGCTFRRHYVIQEEL